MHSLHQRGVFYLFFKEFLNNLSLRLMKYVYLIWIFIVSIQGLTAQDLEGTYEGFKSRWKDKPVTASGSLGFNTNYYAARHSGNIAIPFSYNLYGNVNLDILGINAPLGIFYANKNTTFNLPSYRFIGISPEFRGHKLHLFDRTMEFSPYSFSGTAFTGVGYEGTFGKFYVKAMAGRLNKATIHEANVLNNLDNSFKRIGWAIGGGYKDDKQQYGLHLFQAKDIASSLPDTLQTRVRPQAGSILVLDGSRRVGIFKLSMEYAYNIHTADLNAELPASGRNLFSIIPGWHPTNSSTGRHDAFKSSLQIKAGKATIGLEYERIDPGYISLGTLYFNNDIETMALACQSPFFKNRLTTQVRIGRQRNNLRNDQANQNVRLALSGNINARLTRTLNLGFNFSNFSFNQKSYITVRPVIDLDTLIFTQNNLNTGLSLTKQFSGTNPGSIQMILNYNDARTAREDSVSNVIRLKMITASGGYNKRFTDSEMNMYAGFNYNKVVALLGNSDMWGPTITVSRSFFRKFWESSLSTSFLFDQREGNNRMIFRNFWSNKLKFSENADLDVRLMYSHINNRKVAGTSEFMFQTAFLFRLNEITLIKTFSPNSSKTPDHE